jgi:glyoxylase-like metal-dependent hydrolase (beta-lactamase superfamily II)
VFEQIFPDLFRIEIPLPKNPLKMLNSYLLTDKNKFLIIDTGMNREECLNEMMLALNHLSVDLNRTDFFITHLHADHSGLVGSLATDNSHIYISKTDASIMEAGTREETWRANDAIFLAHGFPEDELIKAMALHPGRIYSSRKKISFHYLKEGDILNFAHYSLKCIATPGHTPGHLCLYEPAKKILFCGDHILFDITPNITSWPNFNNSLKMYLSSLDKINELEINTILPGHRSIMGDQRKRISEIKAHHQARLGEALAALKGGEKTAFHVAPFITWDISFKTWDLFPPAQKIFAVGETIAHLEYLEGENMIKRTIRGQEIKFSLV